MTDNEPNIEEFVVEFQEEIKNEEINKDTFLPDNSQKFLLERPVGDYNSETSIPTVPRIFSEQDMINDFIQVRNDMIIIIESSKALLRNISSQICATKASMITAVATLNNSINSNGKLLLEIHEKIMKLQKDSNLLQQGINPDQPTNITNNNLIVNTKDLNQIIEDVISENKKRAD